MPAANPLIKLLIDLKVLQAAPSAEAFAARSEGPIRAFALLGLLNEIEAIQRLASHLKMEFLDLEARHDTITDLDPDLQTTLNLELLWSHKAVPLRVESGAIVCVLANPLDYDAQRYLQFALQRPMRTCIAEEHKILARLSRCSIAPSITKELQSAADLEPTQKSESVQQDMAAPDPELPLIIRLCNKIFTDAAQMEASDIHLEPGESTLSVRYRIDGVMSNVFEIPAQHQASLISRLKILAGMNIAEKRRPQDGRLKVQVSGEGIDIRAACSPSAGGEKMVLRLLRANTSLYSLEKIGFSTAIETSVRRMLAGSAKLLIVTGPTGSGKTTTLYAFLNHLQDGRSNIVTVEDPVEYRIQGLHQIQVNQAIDVSFAAVLRSVLRQDPDAIMIGEIRDKETAEIALQAAQTGHLVLSTLHTNDAPSAILRLMKLSAEPDLLAATLAGVVAQRLVRRVCPHCVMPAPAAYLEKQRECIEAYQLCGADLCVSSGCEKCFHTGYHGRLGIFSFLEITPPISELIHDRASLAKIDALARTMGFVSLSDAAIGAVRQGYTTLDEVLGYLDPPTLQPAAKAQPTAPQHLHTLKKQKILLVEDDPDIRAILKLVFARELYEVIEATNGLEGLNKVYEHSPQIILCDLMMPVMDGREFLLKLRANQQTRDIPVIMLTAINTEENEVALIDLGANDFVSKGTASAVMLSRVRRALQRSQDGVADR